MNPQPLAPPREQSLLTKRLNPFVSDPFEQEPQSYKKVKENAGPVLRDVPKFYFSISSLSTEVTEKMDSELNTFTETQSSKLHSSSDQEFTIQYPARKESDISLTLSQIEESKINDAASFCSEIFWEANNSTLLQDAEEPLEKPSPLQPLLRKQQHSLFNANENETTQRSHKINEELEQLLHQNQAHLISKLGSNTDENSVVICRCIMNHQFSTSLASLKTRQWCQQCEELLDIARIYAEHNQGTILNAIYLPDLKFACTRNHEFFLSHKDYRKRWCTDCKKLFKQEFKAFMKKEEEKKQKEYQIKQEKLYEEARMSNKSNNSSFGSNSSSNNSSANSSFVGSSNGSDSCPNNANNSSNSGNQQRLTESQLKIIQAAKVVEKEVELLASKQAKEFMSLATFDGKSTFQNCCDVYKILLYPDQVLQVYLGAIEKESLQKEFRNLAKSVHPDKNPHPKAAQAFKKINNFFSIALKKLI